MKFHLVSYVQRPCGDEALPALQGDDASVRSCDGREVGSLRYQIQPACRRCVTELIDETAASSVYLAQCGGD
jgi:hypothetical protein